MTHKGQTSGLMKRRWIWPFAIAVAIAIVFSMVVAVRLGSVNVSTDEIVNTFFAKVLGRQTSVPAHIQQIIWELRFPRVILAAIVGAGLSLAGVTIQGLVRNPIADPYVLGVSSGASVGAAFILLFGSGLLGNAAVTFGSFVTAMIAMFLVYAVAQRNGQLMPLRLVLTGVVMSYIFSGITSFMVFVGDPRAAQTVMFWLLGSFGRARWHLLFIPTLVTAVVFLYVIFRARALDALLAGDEAATALGFRLSRVRLEMFVATAALTAVMVAVSGSIAFVGLVIPHITRLLVGSMHRRVFPLAGLLGALFMIWIDLLARYAASPQEIPLGVITAFAGGPIFLVLMRRQLQRRSA